MTTDTARTAPIALWRIAERFFVVLYALFGGPQDVAAQHTLKWGPYQLIVSWVRCAEAMLRHLLLIEAQAYPKPNTRPLLHPKRQRVRKLISFDPDKPEAWRVSFRCLSSSALRRAKKSAAGPDNVSLPKRTEPVFVFREDRTPPDRTRPPPRRLARRAKRARGKPILRQDRLWVKAEPKLRFRSAWPIAERYEAVSWRKRGILPALAPRYRYEALIRVFNDPASYARRLSRRLHATPHRAFEVLRAPPEAEDRIDRFSELRDFAEARWTRPNDTS